MKIAAIVDFFIGEWRFQENKELRRARLLVRASLLTSLFSNSYVWLSYFFEFEKGAYLMIFNVIGFLLLPFLLRTKIPVSWLGNLFILIGSSAILILTYYSGGIWSAVYPWIISIPVLALLVVNRLSGIIWGSITFIAMVLYGVLALKGIELPLEYNVEMKTAWFVNVVPGLLLIVMFISLVFEHMQRKALEAVEAKNVILNEQKDTIAMQSAKLESLIDEKETIIRIMAHDLRSPLKNIEGLVKLMSADDKVPQDEYVGMIMDSSKSAQELIDRVLAMDANEQKEVDIHYEPTNLKKTIDHLLTRMSEQASKKQIEIEVIDNSASKVVSTDETYLKLILENLISNAIKFSEQGKSVTISILDDEQSVLIKVTDEGPGISPNEEEKLFKKFSKLTARPTGGESSSGLGLSLVKRYAELIGAEVRYKRNDGVGATFVVKLESR